MKYPILLITILLFHFRVEAQSKAEFAHAKRLYEGTWMKKKAKRYLSFSFEKEVNYVTINDWTGKADPTKNDNIDAYKAYIKGNKLILPAENSDHHAPYGEIEIVGGKLIYRCNTGLNFTEDVLSKSKPIDRVIFEKVRL